MLVTKRDLGYTLYSRLEEGLRSWVGDRLNALFGEKWKEQIPQGIWERFQGSCEEIADLSEVLEETNLPDLVGIIEYRKNNSGFLNERVMSLTDFKMLINRLYELRCQIAHVRGLFTALDLDLLMEITQRLGAILGSYCEEARCVAEAIRAGKEVVIVVPPPQFSWQVDGDTLNRHSRITNLPPSDYDPDGGFVGRRDDLRRIEALVLGDVHRVITVSGAGGVGKTALVHQVCSNLLTRANVPFDAIVWVSAKEERLTATRIEPIEPSAQTYESLLDAILETCGWLDDLAKSLHEKEHSVDVILRAGRYGILLVVDNLETIHDDKVWDFIKDFPPPSKVLITSRQGLGEVERRYPLTEMDARDAVALFRTVAREKGVIDLARAHDSVLNSYVQRMYRYPLAIKWVLGQVALGKDLERAVTDLTSPTGDIARFCFQQTFDFMHGDAKMVLYALVSGEGALSMGVLLHLSNLTQDRLEKAIGDLTVASLIVPVRSMSDDDVVETKYDLLPITRNYIHSQLQTQPGIGTEIRNRARMVTSLLEDAARVAKAYRYSLRNMGAETDEEKVAATLAFTAYQKHQSGDYEGAVADFEKAAQIAPELPTIYRNWAIVELDAGYQEKADRLMQTASTLGPKDSTVWFTWGNIETRRGRYDKARDYLSKALVLSPNDAPILGALGQVEKRRGDFESAHGLLLKALESGAKANPSNIRHLVVSHTSIADNLRRWAESLGRERRWAEALEKSRDAHQYAERAYQAAPEDRQAQDTFREVSIDLGIRLMRGGRTEEARKQLESAVVHNPRRVKDKKVNTIACLYLSDYLIGAGEMDDARRFYTLGKRSLMEGSTYTERYRSLGLEFSHARSTGVLIRAADRGYGFILEKETDRSVFVHVSEIDPKVGDDLHVLVGSTLSYIAVEEEKGLCAKRVRLTRPTQTP